MNFTHIHIRSKIEWPLVVSGHLFPNCNFYPALLALVCYSDVVTGLDWSVWWPGRRLQLSSE